MSGEVSGVCGGGLKVCRQETKMVREREREREGEREREREREIATRKAEKSW